MTWKIRLAAVWFFLSISVNVLPASAAHVDWLISSTDSSVKLNIPDLTSVLQNVSVPIRFRNQSGGDSGPWTTGSTASLAGTIPTNYQEGLSPSIEFLPADIGDIVGLNSGAYRPNPAAYSSGTVLPDGTATGGSFLGVGTAAGVYGTRMRATILSSTSDVMFLGFRDVSFALSSATLGVNSLTGAFAANTANFGIQHTLVGVDLVSVLLVVTPDQIVAVSGMTGTNQAATGTVTSPDPIGQPNLRKLTLPITAPTILQLGELSIPVTMTGSVVAFATVPEPSTIVLACIGAIAIAGARRRAFSRATSRTSNLR
jgi:hypothetical protein